MPKPFDQTRAFELASFKAVDVGAGEFEALVSVFGNVDHGGDRVVKGAFAKSLAAWQEKGDPIPVIWNHMWENPEAHIGAVKAEDAVETDTGLLVKGRLDLDNPFAAQVYRLLSERRVKEFSFGYKVVNAERKERSLDLLELDLFEVGPTLKGMNPATELLAVKALADALAGPVAPAPWPNAVDDVRAAVASMSSVKAGARHSKETLAALTRMREELDRLIAAGEPADEPPKSDDAKALGTASDPDEDITIQLKLLKEQLQ